MKFNSTWHERVAIEFYAPTNEGRGRKTTALEKPAGEAGNRHGFDLDVTPWK